jgi:hypothetical protein
MINLRQLLGWQPDIELDADAAEYRRPPRVLRGDLDMEGHSGLGDVYLSAPRPRWTTVPPSHEGLWFVRVPGHARKVAEVFRGQDGRLLMRWTDFGPFALPRSDVQWSDRAISEPVETKP